MGNEKNSKNDAGLPAEIYNTALINVTVLTDIETKLKQAKTDE